MCVSSAASTAALLVGLGCSRSGHRRFRRRRDQLVELAVQHDLLAPRPSRCSAARPWSGSPGAHRGSLVHSCTACSPSSAASSAIWRLSVAAVWSRKPLALRRCPLRRQRSDDRCRRRPRSERSPDWSPPPSSSRRLNRSGCSASLRLRAYCPHRLVGAGRGAPEVMNRASVARRRREESGGSASKRAAIASFGQQGQGSAAVHRDHPMADCDAAALVGGCAHAPSGGQWFRRSDVFVSHRASLRGGRGEADGARGRRRACWVGHDVAGHRDEAAERPARPSRPWPASATMRPLNHGPRRAFTGHLPWVCRHGCAEDVDHGIRARNRVQSGRRTGAHPAETPTAAFAQLWIGARPVWRRATSAPGAVGRAESSRRLLDCVLARRGRATQPVERPPASSTAPRRRSPDGSRMTSATRVPCAGVSIRAMRVLE